MILLDILVRIRVVGQAGGNKDLSIPCRSSVHWFYQLRQPLKQNAYTQLFNNYKRSLTSLSAFDRFSFISFVVDMFGSIMNGCIGQARIKGMQKQLILIMEDCALCCDISTYLVKMVCYFSYLRYYVFVWFDFLTL